jgi:hypothetical protein
MPSHRTERPLLSSEAVTYRRSVAAARRRALPRNQYRCSFCGGAHVYGSERGRQCGATSGQQWGQHRAQVRVPTDYWGPPPTLAPRVSSAHPSVPPAPQQRRPSEVVTPRTPVRRPPPPRRRAARAAAEQELSGARLKIETATLTYVFDEDGFYEQLADKLIENLP